MFRKVARAQVLGQLNLDSDGRLHYRPQAGRPEAVSTGYCKDGARVIPFREILSRVADQYAISSDPRDYLLEAIRANTTNTPNENNDAFHRSELLRFDTRAGMPVYQTYQEKPHHVDHRTENPKTARGVIIDAHYNDSAPPLAECPRCSSHTADRQNRDQSGIHCRRCGQVVKDEFTEILLGVDSKKDPRFARGVKTGELSAGSMGCSCLSTVCNVCGHVAYSRPEFCAHIQAGNKGALWQKQDNLWIKTQPIAVERIAARLGYKWDPADFCYLIGGDGDVEIRRGYESCLDVAFDEYSRVRQPADPKALQREVLGIGLGATAGVIPSIHELTQETEMLLKAQPSQQRKAMRYTVVKVDDQIAAGETLDEALADATVGEAGVGGAMYYEVDAASPEEAIGKWDDMMAQPVPENRGAEVVVQAPPGEEVIVQPSDMGPEHPEVGPPGAIEEYEPEPIDERVTPEELGVMPPGASKQSRRQPAERRQPMRFAKAYRDWTVEVSPQGNARVFTGEKHQIMVVRGPPESDPQRRKAYGVSLLQSLWRDGVVKTATKRKGLYTPKIAQVVDGAIDDMKEFADKYLHDSVREEAAENNDMQGDVRKAPPDKVPDDVNADMEGGARRAPPSSVRDEAIVDHVDGPDGAPTRVTQEDATDMKDEKRSPVNLGSDSVLQNEEHDHTEKLAAVGTKIAYKQRPEITWQVEAKSGPNHIVVASGNVKRRVKVADLLEHWTALDTAKPAPTLTERIAEAEKEKEAEEDKESCRKVSAPAVPAPDLKAYEARLKKAWASREAQLKKAHAAELEGSKQGVLESFCRAMRLAAHRQAVGLENNPLKCIAERTLGTTRVLAKDAHGNSLEYQGMDHDLARYLSAELLTRGHAEHLENLMTRAADLMSKGDQYLLDAEADARNLKPALPSITAANVAMPDPASQQAHATRQAALQGNFALNAAPAEVASEPISNKQAAIRGAVQGTLVGNTLAGLKGLN